MGEEPAIADPMRYRAFISYNHADTKFAHWLHRKLETWRLPDKSRLAPIFIDRAELAAGSDLSAQVREALGQSAALVVVCSPNAKASRWVSQEIALFRALHPDRPVLAALIGGEPGEAFPEALVKAEGREFEPLAADFRKGHDGQRLGLLKLAAGLTGLPLDRLVQRDAAARQRRVMAITAAALALVLVLSAALVIALRARAEAERQRAEAEGLVEFMLTDLRDKLRGTGDPKIMASVNQQALDYYSRMDVTSLPDDSLERRARVLHAMGEDNERLGNFPAAQKMYLEAWRITDEVLKRRPNEPDAIFAHAQSEFWVGKAAWEQGDLQTVGHHWQGYLRQAEVLAIVEPGTNRSLLELGYAYGNNCEWTVRSLPSEIGRAAKLCTAASGYLRRALNASPSDVTTAMALANRLGWQAEVTLKARSFDQALALRQEEAAILDRIIARDRTNFELKERRLWPQIGIGETLIAAAKTDQGLKVLTVTLKSYDQLAASRPNHTGIIEQQFRVAWILAKETRKAGLPVQHTYRKRAEEIYKQLSNSRSSSQMLRFNKMITMLRKDTEYER